MIKKILLSATFVLSIMSSQVLAIDNKITEPQTYGLFKLYFNDDNALTIARAERLDVYLTYKDSIRIFGNYNKAYSQLTTPKQKADFAYKLLVKIANNADFKASLRKNDSGDQVFGVTIFEKKLDGGLRNQLIPAKDMSTVFPRLIQLIKNQQSSYIPLKSRNKSQSVIIKMPMNNLNWPYSEYWFDDWYQWVEAELRATCYTSGDERLCSEWDITSRDSNNDGEKDIVCGNYSNYHGATEKEFHCVHK